MSDERQPWERQPIDTDESWQAFVHYRDARPPRYLRKTFANQVRQPMYKTSRWYTDHGWRERVAAYDAHLDKIMCEEREAVLREDAKNLAVRHRGILADACELAEREVTKLLEASKSGDAVGLLKPSEVTKMMETVIKLDRLVREQSTETVRHDFEEVDLADLKALEEKLRKRSGQ